MANTLLKDASECWRMEKKAVKPRLQFRKKLGGKKPKYQVTSVEGEVMNFVRQITQNHIKPLSKEY